MNNNTIGTRREKLFWCLWADLFALHYQRGFFYYHPTSVKLRKVEIYLSSGQFMIEPNVEMSLSNQPAKCDLI